MAASLGRSLRSRARGWHSSRLLLVIAAFTVIGATGCGQSAAPTSTSSGSSAGVQEAKQLVATEEKMLDTWPAPGPAFDATKARGKLIWYISGDLSSEFEHQLTQGMSEAAQAVGARFTAIDGKGQATEYARAVDEGVAQHADVIVLGGVQPRVVARSSPMPRRRAFLSSDSIPTTTCWPSSSMFASILPAFEGL